MKPILISALFFSICIASCRKPDNPNPKPTAAHTDGLGTPRNWHVYVHYNVYRHIDPDSGFYHDTAYWLPDQSFALTTIGSDTVQCNNQNYFFHHTSGSIDYFRIWHTQYSGNPSQITHNLDSNTITIYLKDISVNFTNEQWYYSF